MEILEFLGKGINRRHIDRAIAELEAGKIIIIPTDSLYALACDALNGKTIERICRIKGLNPDKQSLSIICSGLSQASEYARIDNRAYRVLKANLPGPFTFILPADTRLPRAFKGRKTVGVRVPECEVATALADALGRPLMVTSVAPGEENEYTEPVQIAELHKHDVVILLDGGIIGAEPSAVVDLTDPADPVVLRDGPRELL